MAPTWFRKCKNKVFGPGEIRIISVGPSGVGKSVIGNTLLGIGRKDPQYLKNEPTAVSCTQAPSSITSKDGKITYTDVPGIPDTKPQHTKAFYDMLIDEVKDPCTAILFVFAVDDRMDGPQKLRIKQCSLLFEEINKSAATKILLLNDKNAWSNMESLDEDEDDYKEEKDKWDQDRKACQEAYEAEVKEATGINFLFTKVCYGLHKMNEGNMKDVLKDLKKDLECFDTNPSEHLRTFKELEALEEEARQKKDYEQRFVDE